jgi:hypothetical protein
MAVPVLLAAFVITRATASMPSFRGWNSWDSYLGNPNENDTLAIAEYMADALLPFGYCRDPMCGELVGVMFFAVSVISGCTQPTVNHTALVHLHVAPGTMFSPLTKAGMICLAGM